MLKKRPDYATLVFSNLTEKQIFEAYFGETVELGKSYSSRFRSDLNPSTGFYISASGKLIYNDLTNGEKHGCIGFVMRKFGLTYIQALIKIIADFNLTGEGTPMIEPPPKLVKEEVFINVLPRKFTEQDVAFFKSYCITSEEVKRYNIHSVESLLIRGKIIHTKKDEIKLAYVLEDKYAKIYSPSNDKFKWITNIPLNKPFGLHDLPKLSKRLIITKSLKDMIVLRKFFPDTMSLQNESLAALSDDVYSQIKDSYDEIIIFFDNDEPGKKASNLYAEKYGFKEIRIPERALEKCGVKDPSDYIKQFGLDELKKLFRWLKLL